MLYSGVSVIIGMAACFQNIIETNQIRLNISIWIGDRIPHTCLCRQVYHNSRLIGLENLPDQIRISDVSFDKSPGRIRMLFRFLFNLLQSPFLHFNRIIIGHDIDTHNMNRLHRSEQFQNQIITDKPSSTGDQYCFSC